MSSLDRLQRLYVVEMCKFYPVDTEEYLINLQISGFEVGDYKNVQCKNRVGCSTGCCRGSWKCYSNLDNELKNCTLLAEPFFWLLNYGVIEKNSA